MPDLPVELWTVVCRLLVKPSLPDLVTYQNDLCAVARVSSVSPVHASQLIVEPQFRSIPLSVRSDSCH